MSYVKYCIALAKKKLLREKDAVIDCFRKSGIKVGDNCAIFSNIVTGEPYLISIGNNVTISTDVVFVTHDASIGVLLGKDKLSDLCGRIEIGDNCFIGTRSIVMYGVALSNNIIVAAGSVVTKSFNEERIIIGGNPARKISTWDELEHKAITNGLLLHGKNLKEIKNTILINEDKLIKR
jgi:acetyltransferase-like isoleucine patch superfamily enzyme